MSKAIDLEECGCGEIMECEKSAGYVVTEYMKGAYKTYE